MTLKGNELAAARLSVYDDSYVYACKLYDNLPYVRDPDICNESTVRMFSGNVIKFNAYNVTHEVTIDNGDKEFAQILAQIRMEASVVDEVEVIEEEYEDEELTKEDALVEGLVTDYDREDAADGFGGVIISDEDDRTYISDVM